MERVINIDDGGSFEKLMEEVKKGAEDESKVMELLQRKILTAFVNKIRQEAINDHYNNHLLDTNFVPEKKRSNIGEHITFFNKPPSPQEEDRKIKKKVSRKRCFESENSEEEEEEEEEEKKKMRIIKKVKIIKKPKKAEKVDFANLGLDPPPDIPDELRKRIEKMDGKYIKLVIMKPMFKTDLSRHHDRLSIPWNQIIDNDFHKEDEIMKLNKENLTVNVKLLEPCGFTSNMVLRQWNLQNTSSYALTTSWKSVLDRNLDVEFKQNDIMQLWSFRVNKELRLALNKVWDAPKDNDIAIGTSGSDSSRGNGDHVHGASTSHSSTVVDQE